MIFFLATGVKPEFLRWLMEGLTWGRETVVPATISYWQKEEAAPREALRQGLPFLGGLEKSRGRENWFNSLLYFLTSYNLRDPRTFFQAQLPTVKKEEFLAEMSLAEEVTPVPLPPPTAGELPPSVSSPAKETTTSPERPFSFYGRTPLVAIYHTHSSETYHGPHAHPPGVRSFSGDYSWGKTDGMITIGDELARALAEKHGIPVVHSRRIHDYPVFRLAYVNSQKTVRAILEKYPGVVLLLDLHRDGMGTPTQETITTTVQGEKLARIAIIVGRGRTGLLNPHWQKNLALAKRLEERMNQIYPGLCRGIIIKDWPYNQELHPGALLLEIGDHNNTKSEAIRSVQLLADVLADLLPDLVKERTPPVLRRSWP